MLQGVLRRLKSHDLILEGSEANKINEYQQGDVNNSFVHACFMSINYTARNIIRRKCMMICLVEILYTSTERLFRELLEFILTKGDGDTPWVLLFHRCSHFLIIHKAKSISNKQFAKCREVKKDFRERMMNSVCSRVTIFCELFISSLLPLSHNSQSKKYLK